VLRRRRRRRRRRHRRSELSSPLGPKVTRGGGLNLLAGWRNDWPTWCTATCGAAVRKLSGAGSAGRPRAAAGAKLGCGTGRDNGDRVVDAF
jgi:hypothetical protein